MVDLDMALGRWHLDRSQVWDRVYRAPTPRERERWHALSLLTRGRSAAQVAEAFGRDAHTIGEWAAKFQEQGAAGLVFEQTGGPPRSRHGAAV